MIGLLGRLCYPATCNTDRIKRISTQGILEEAKVPMHGPNIQKLVTNLRNSITIQQRKEKEKKTRKG
jgi:hypothetical protein